VNNEPNAASPLPHGFTAPDAPSYEILNTCVHCGLCLPTCPTYRETLREQSSPRGRLHLMQAVSEGRVDVLDPTFTGQMYECLDCRACEAVCPSGVRYAEVLEDSRAQIERRRRPGLQERLLRRAVYGLAFSDLRLLRLMATVLRFYQRSGLAAFARRSGVLRLLHANRLEALAPPMPASFFVPRGQVFRAQGERRGSVSLLAGCVMHTAFAEIDRATVRLLARNGWDVVVPAEQGCCGALHVHAGELDAARTLARSNIRAFEATGTDLIVSNAAGCGAALKEYGRLLADDPVWADRAARLAERARDATEVLTLAPLRGQLGRIDLTATYQDPCHLMHAQRIAAQPRALLAAIPGLRVVEMDEATLCCGSAGVYNVTQPEMSAALLDRKLRNALQTGPDLIVTANPGCMLQLRSGLRAKARSAENQPRVVHIVELLDAAYRGDGSGSALASTDRI
jgi:glycolate oxidase iron-sulfur subunit